MLVEKLLNRPREMYELPRAQKPQHLPSVFSESEVLAIIKASDNLKHKNSIFRYKKDEYIR